MALISCPECGKRISEHVDRCPHCGLERSKFGDIASLNMSLMKQIKAERHRLIKKVCLKVVLPIVIVGGSIGLYLAYLDYEKQERRRKEAEFTAEGIRNYEEHVNREKSEAKKEFKRKTNLELTGDYEPGYIRKLMEGKNCVGSMARDKV